jgi:RNA-directed DNA polymerase
LADTSVANAVARRREAISAQAFSDFSPGCRPGRRPPQALQEGRQGRLGNRRGQVIDWDISAFVDTLPHDTLLEMLRKRVQDGRVLELNARGRHAGLLDGKARVFPDQGSPHGAVRSPLRATVYGHEGLDPWCATVVRAHGRGKVARWRFADACIIGGAWAEDARRIKEVRPKRVAKYGLEINTDKTPGVDVGRPQRSAAGRQPGTCSFLGFVHSWGKTWRGGHTITRKTEGTRLRRPLGAFWRWCRDNRHRPLQEQYALRCAQRRGDSQYDGLRCNSPC